MFHIFASHEEMKIKQFEDTKKKLEKETKNNEENDKASNMSVRKRTIEPEYKRKLVSHKPFRMP